MCLVISLNARLLRIISLVSPPDSNAFSLTQSMHIPPPGLAVVLHNRQMSKANV